MCHRVKWTWFRDVLTRMQSLTDVVNHYNIPTLDRQTQVSCHRQLLEFSSLECESVCQGELWLYNNYTLSAIK